jgi:methylmalonyl-CoA carboxyltransferase large subunit
MQEKIEELRKRRKETMLGGGADKLEKQHKEGKMTARERIDLMVDPNSFEEAGLFAEHRAVLFGMAGKSFPADGVVTGAASVQGRLVHLASQDFSVAGGSAGEVHSVKVAEIMEQSLKTGSFVKITNSRLQFKVQKREECKHRVLYPKLYVYDFEVIEVGTNPESHEETKKQVQANN